MNDEIKDIKVEMQILKSQRDDAYNKINAINKKIEHCKQKLDKLEKR